MATEKSVASVKAPRPGESPFQRWGKYLGEVRAELKKTTWPTRAEVIAQTKVVLGLLVIVGVFIATWDFILGLIFRVLLRLLGANLDR